MRLPGYPQQTEVQNELRYAMQILGPLHIENNNTEGASISLKPG